MIWQSFDEFQAMGGQGLYVWGGYLMVAAALAWERLMLAQRRSRALEDLRDALPLQGTTLQA